MGVRLAEGKLKKDNRSNFWTVYVYKTILSAIWLWLKRNRLDLTGAKGKRIPAHLLVEPGSAKTKVLGFHTEMTDEDIWHCILPSVPADEFSLDIKTLRSKLRPNDQFILDYLVESGDRIYDVLTEESKSSGDQILHSISP
jgi:hypothetical protein